MPTSTAAPAPPRAVTAAPAGPLRSAGHLARDLLELTRPHQWVKNVVVVLPLLLATSWSVGSVVSVAWAALLFTLASALVYVGNDVADRDRDRSHPVKRHRPVASGRVPVPAATALAVGLLCAIVAIAALSPVAAWWPVALYLVLNVAYSTHLKHLPMIEVFIVASGFVLRLVEGYLATGDAVPAWLVVCVLCLCLLFGFGKRRAELSAGAAHRPSLAGYSVQLLEQLILLNAVLVIATFLLFLHSQAPLGAYAETAVLVSAPFGLFAVFRYLQVVFVDQGARGATSGDPVRLLVRDPRMRVNSLLWVGALGVVVLISRFPAVASFAGLGV